MVKRTATAPEAALEFQLRALGIPFEREVEFCLPRKFRADFIVRRHDGAALIVEVQGRRLGWRLSRARAWNGG